ncbi:unnamed protein product [Kuraishia capsulata CBS 1993]|uniref:ZIP zinc/iron transport family n=1 Tax=Kuraishia capsulata CBS 1993 TaxID=1382522 RepID=W6MQK5_9ASCO|nr:uncharacterized protein KUCA_T00000135001 [Kuraishia capsulata CBS 1993]CDK24175.1 unnamed protein product [Kuraishia capsulata CBS 1993]
MDLVNLATRDSCGTGNDFNGDHMGARISAVFVILATSSLSAFFPLLSSKYSTIRVPSWCFFIAKYFGSGVIVATAFIHLLQPANESLSTECLGGVFQEYPMAFAICLITLFLMFFAELIAYRWVEEKVAKAIGVLPMVENVHSHFGDQDLYIKNSEETDLKKFEESAQEEHTDMHAHSHADASSTNPYPAHFAHAAHHQDPEVLGTPAADPGLETYYGQLLNVFVLEFGIVFHSIFIGLTLSCSGDEFVTLYIVVVFHQAFEGLGLGTRIALVDWPKARRWTPWILALGYGLTTPIAVAIGLGVRTSYPTHSRTALIVNGVFDSVSAGILTYTGLIELMAHEFLFSDEFKGKGGLSKMVKAYFVMCTGAGVMALLGKWA